MQSGMSVSYGRRRPQFAVQCGRRPTGGAADEDVVDTSRVRELERRVREFERLLGRNFLSDLPLNFHPAAFRASTNVTPFGAVSVPA